MKRYLIAAAMFMSSQIAFAAEPVDLLGLDKLSVGAKPSYGKYLIKHKDGYLSGEPNAIDNGSLELNVSFSGNFAIIGDWNLDRGEIRLITDGYEIKFDNSRGNYDVYVGGKDVGDFDTQGTFKLSFVNNELKTFNSNNTVLSTIPLKENLTFTKLIISGIKETDKITRLEVVGDTAVVTPPISISCPTSPTTPTGGAAVTLDANLNMKIPNATYQPALGNPINLWANFQFVPSSDGSMTWKLSNYGINP